MKFLRDELSLIVAGMVVGVLLAFGRFSDRQGVALALMLVTVHLLTKRAVRKEVLDDPTLRPLRLTPFSIRIRPNSELLLKDNGFIDDAKWQELLNRSYSTDYHVLRDGIAFTVIQENLIYSDNHHYFFSRSDMDYGIREDIEEISRGIFQTYRFCVRITDFGYEIGVTTPESEKSSEFNPEPDSHFILIATLPHVVFEYFYGSEELFEKYEERRNLRLSELGWTEQDRSGPVFAPTQPLRYEHKYVRVDVRAIH